MLGRKSKSHFALSALLVAIWMCVAICWHLGPDNSLHRLDVPGAKVRSRTLPVNLLNGKDLTRVSNRVLNVGMKRGEVHESLVSKKLRLFVTDHSSMRHTSIYGAGSLGDPVLFVEYLKGENGQWLLSEWRVEL